jgi:hypothetical protein
LCKRMDRVGDRRCFVVRRYQYRHTRIVVEAASEQPTVNIKLKARNALMKLGTSAMPLKLMTASALPVTSLSSRTYGSATPADLASHPTLRA